MKTLTLLVAALLLHAGAHAAASESDAVLAALKQQYPGTTFTSVAPAPVKGLYEVVMGRKIAYTDKSGRYFVYGSVVDMTTNDDLTAVRQQDLLRVDPAQLPLRDSITRVIGKGRRTIYVFSDPDCPYCRRLEGELDKLDDVTIHIFPYPIESLHNDAARKAQAIWCQGDDKKRLAMWRRVVADNEDIATARCDNPLLRNLTLGESLGVEGTPTLVAADGRRLPGLMPAARIDEWLALTKPVAMTKATN